MKTQQLMAEIDALPEQARAAIEQLVLVLRQQVPTRVPLPIIQASTLLTDEEKIAENAETGGWASRSDITDGAEYIHQVRRGLRQP